MQPLRRGWESHSALSRRCTPNKLSRLYKHCIQPRFIYLDVSISIRDLRQSGTGISSGTLRSAIKYAQWRRQAWGTGARDPPGVWCLLLFRTDSVLKRRRLRWAESQNQRKVSKVTVWICIARYHEWLIPKSFRYDTRVWTRDHTVSPENAVHTFIHKWNNSNKPYLS